MVRLSVNVNKICTLRNTRDLNRPDLLHLTRIAIESGAHGITVHPRPDERHIRASDMSPLTSLVRSHPSVELNFEGNPFHGDYLNYCIDLRPDQCTLVPDDLTQRTSDHGWRLDDTDMKRLEPVVAKLKSAGLRVSLFVDFDHPRIERAKQLGADRVELYTEPYAARHARGDASVVRDFAEAADRAVDAGLGVNAGHDLNLDNLPDLVRAIPRLDEVSIGHALIADALELGLAETVRRYLKACRA